MVEIICTGKTKTRLQYCCGIETVIYSTLAGDAHEREREMVNGFLMRVTRQQSANQLFVP